MTEVVHEWRVTGEPGQGYPSYSFTWRSGDDRWPTPEQAEAAARAFVAQFPKMWNEMPSLEPWVEGPDLSHRTVTYTDWESA